MAGCADDESEDQAVADDTSISSDAVSAEEGESLAPAEATWSLVAIGEDLDPDVGPGDFDLYDVVRGGPGFVAVGGSEHLPVVWTSPDGEGWTRATDVPETVPGGPGFGGLVMVTTGGPGLVAIGGPGPFGLGEIAVWASPDGLSWTHVGGGDAMFGADVEAVAVAAGGPGLVAIGTSASDARPAVWTSPDGVSWTQLDPDDTGFDAAALRAVTAGGPGLVAVGGTSDGMAAVWTTSDGVSWKRVDPDNADFGAAELVDVTAGGPGLVAVGTSDSDEGTSLWVSTDGAIWTKVPSSSEREPRLLIAGTSFRFWCRSGPAR